MLYRVAISHSIDVENNGTSIMRIQGKKNKQSNRGKGISRKNKTVSNLLPLMCSTIIPTESPNYPLIPLGKIRWTAAFLTDQREERK